MVEIGSRVLHCWAPNPQMLSHKSNCISTTAYELLDTFLKVSWSRYIYLGSLRKMVVGNCFCGKVRIELSGQPLRAVSTTHMDQAFMSRI